MQTIGLESYIKTEVGVIWELYGPVYENYEILSLLDDDLWQGRTHWTLSAKVFTFIRKGPGPLKWEYKDEVLSIWNTFRNRNPKVEL